MQNQKQNLTKNYSEEAEKKDQTTNETKKNSGFTIHVAYTLLKFLHHTKFRYFLCGVPKPGFSFARRGYRQCEYYKQSWHKQCNNVVSYEFIWIRRTCDYI